MKLNITVDMSDLFSESQELVAETADIEHESFGSQVVDYESYSLKESIEHRVISDAVRAIDRKSIDAAISRLSLRETDLNKGFDDMAKNNIKNAIRSKVNQWIETGVIDTNGSETTFSSHVEKEAATAIRNMNNKHSVECFEDTISEIIKNKVESVISGYENQIKKEVDLVASSIIQEKVSQTLTETFTNLMKSNNTLSVSDSSNG